MLGPLQAWFITLLSKHVAGYEGEEKSGVNMSYLGNTWGRRQWILDLGEYKG